MVKVLVEIWKRIWHKRQQCNLASFVTKWPFRLSPNAIYDLYKSVYKAYTWWLFV